MRLDVSAAAAGMPKAGGIDSKLARSVILACRALDGFHCRGHVYAVPRISKRVRRHQVQARQEKHAAGRTPRSGVSSLAAAAADARYAHQLPRCGFVEA